MAFGRTQYWHLSTTKTTSKTTTIAKTCYSSVTKRCRRAIIIVSAVFWSCSGSGSVSNEKFLICCCYTDATQPPPPPPLLLAVGVDSHRHTRPVPESQGMPKAAEQRPLRGWIECLPGITWKARCTSQIILYTIPGRRTFEPKAENVSAGFNCTQRCVCVWEWCAPLRTHSSKQRCGDDDINNNKNNGKIAETRQSFVARRETIQFLMKKKEEREEPGEKELQNL